MGRGMATQDFLLSPPGDSGALDLTHAQIIQYILTVVRNQYFFVQCKEVVQPGPRIADDWCTTGRRFKQAHAGGVSCFNHILARDIQSELLRLIKLTMPV